jgi:hypothetical protein
MTAQAGGAPTRGHPTRSLLCADISNGHTQLGLLESGRVVADWLVSTD